MVEGLGPVLASEFMVVSGLRVWLGAHGFCKGVGVWEQCLEPIPNCEPFWQMHRKGFVLEFLGAGVCREDFAEQATLAACSTPRMQSLHILSLADLQKLPR